MGIASFLVEEAGCLSDLVITARIVGYSFYREAPGRGVAFLSSAVLAVYGTAYLNKLAGSIHLTISSFHCHFTSLILREL